VNGEEILVAAKEHLHDGKNWIKGKYTGTTGETVTSTESAFVEFVQNHDHCLIGAVQCVLEVEPSAELWETTLHRLEDELRAIFIDYAPKTAERLTEIMDPVGGILSVEGFNDFNTTTWEDIDRVLDKAIARAGELGL